MVQGGLFCTLHLVDYRRMSLNPLLKAVRWTLRLDSAARQRCL